jgi:hypothetical protein
MKLRPGEAELFYVDRRRDGKTDEQDEAKSHFLQFCEIA